MKRFRICLRSSQPDTRLNVGGQGKKAFKVGFLDFPGGTQWLRLSFQCRGHGFDPWSGN